MSISYYTMDDAGRRKPPSAKQSVVEQFHNLGDALARYRELPETGEKTLGMVDGIRALELVRCVPLFPTDREGESILSSDPRKHEFWAKRPEAILAMETCKRNLSNELFAIADRNEGKLKNRVVFFCDEFGTMPPFDVMALFSAGRSRKLTMVPIIQSVAQLEDNYKKTGSEILIDNCQLTVAGGFTPQSETAESVSRALGNRTVLSGSVSRGKNDPSQSLQMMERPLMSPDELKSIPKGHFIVMKTGTHPMQTRLPLFLDWGITFDEPYQMPERANRKIAYANKEDLVNSIMASRSGRGIYNTKREGMI